MALLCFGVPQRRLSHTQKGEKIASTKMMNENQEDYQTTVEQAKKETFFVLKTFHLTYIGRP